MRLSVTSILMTKDTMTYTGWTDDGKELVIQISKDDLAAHLASCFNFQTVPTKLKEENPL